MSEIVKQYRKCNTPKTLTKKERKAEGIGKDQGISKLMYARISPTKVRIVINLIKGKSVNEAMGILNHTPKAASPILAKLLKSAVANAENNNNLDIEKLYISDAYANPGPTLKRVQPRAQGRAFKILKRTSHITLVTKERD